MPANPSRRNRTDRMREIDLLLLEELNAPQLRD
jgi:hypothetical protein